MTTPPSLRSGDLIGIAAPAGKPDREKVKDAINVLYNWGLRVKAAEHLFDEYFNFSATDENRLSDFQEMLDDPDIKAILCARGGYGTIRIIDRLDFRALVNNPKWIIGFSDITVLHSHIQQHVGLETIHGTMAAGLARSGASHDTSQNLKTILFGNTPHYALNSHYLSRKGECSGFLTGGNLAILCSLIGTSSEVNTRGKILFLEEIGEHLYRIDRMMQQMKRAGQLAGLAGLMIGSFTDIPDKKEDFGRTAVEIIADTVCEYNFPVCFGFPAGHQEDNQPLIFGRQAELHVSETTTLTFHSSKCTT